jgi:hypothetical protein
VGSSGVGGWLGRWPLAGAEIRAGELLARDRDGPSPTIVQRAGAYEKPNHSSIAKTQQRQGTNFPDLCIPGLGTGTVQRINREFHALRS